MTTSSLSKRKKGTQWVSLTIIAFLSLPMKRLHTVTKKGKKTKTSTMMMISDREGSRFLFILSDSNFSLSVMMGLSLSRGDRRVTERESEEREHTLKQRKQKRDKRSLSIWERMKESLTNVWWNHHCNTKTVWSSPLVVFVVVVIVFAQQPSHHDHQGRGSHVMCVRFLLSDCFPLVFILFSSFLSSFAAKESETTHLSTQPFPCPAVCPLLVLNLLHGLTWSHVHAFLQSKKINFRL